MHLRNSGIFSASVHRYLCGMSELVFDYESFVIGWISCMRGVIGFNWNQKQIPVCSKADASAIQTTVTPRSV